MLRYKTTVPGAGFHIPSLPRANTPHRAAETTKELETFTCPVVFVRADEGESELLLIC